MGGGGGGVRKQALRTEHHLCQPAKKQSNDPLNLRGKERGGGGEGNKHWPLWGREKEGYKHWPLWGREKEDDKHWPLSGREKEDDKHWPLYLRDLCGGQCPGRAERGGQLSPEHHALLGQLQQRQAHEFPQVQPTHGLLKPAHSNRK